MSPFSDREYNLRIEIDAQDFRLSNHDRQRIVETAAPLERMVTRFPRSDLYVTLMRHPRSREFQCKTSLVLSGATLFTGDHSDQWYSAYARCIRKLMNKVKAYEAKLGCEPQKDKRAKGTVYKVRPDWQPDPEKLAQAVQDGEYVTFRSELYGYDEPVRKRAGRWIEGAPAIESRLGRELHLEDVVEEVMLNAFEHYGGKPQEVSLGDWLEGWIEPSVSNLLRRPAEEKDNVDFARTWQETTVENSSRPSGG